MTRENAFALQTTQNEKFSRIKQTLKKKTNNFKIFLFANGTNYSI